MTDNIMASGHTACAGCGEALGMKLLTNVLGPNTIIANATGCSEIFTTLWPRTAWRVPWIHSLFENAPAVASGIEAALKAQGREKGIQIVAMGGDGAMADIGFGALSGMLERGHNILSVCLDNEGYMNTGIQRSGLTPLYASTTTCPSGKASKGNDTPKKDLPAIVAAHGTKYVATATVAYPRDLEKKVKKAMEIEGPKYIHILVPCPLGWGFDVSETIMLSRLAVQTGLFPVYEMENGKITSVMKIGKKVPVEEYLKLQKRFKHLFHGDCQGQLAVIQEIADANIARFSLMAEAKREPVPAV